MTVQRAAIVTPRRLAVLVFVAAVIVAAILLPWRSFALSQVAAARDAGPFGLLLFSVSYVLAALLLLPASVLTLGAGFAYGPWWGLLLISPVSVLAATVAFLIGRTVARDWVKRRIGDNPRFSAIDRAVGDSGFKMVLLLRLSPVIPFNLLNFALGITSVKLRDYVLGSFLGMLPGTIMYLYLGSLVSNAAQLLDGGAPEKTLAQTILFYGGLAATVVVALFVARMAQRAVNQALAE